MEEPHSIYVSTMLMPIEEENYPKLVFEYKDVFAWSNTRMPRLDPKVMVYNLSLKKGISP